MIARFPALMLHSTVSFLWRGSAQSSPVAVPEKIFGLTLFLDFFDRCHSLTSLFLPPAALGSLPLWESWQKSLIFD
ncbi:MAG: hypothetical protein IKW50_02680 [Oscillospiraceae bacterium]|nr:hypothetical protein [Oscillospiraceae bacterium]